MKFKPLGERALVQIVEREETTASGIVLPDTAKEKPQTAKVVAVGEGKLDKDDQRVPVEAVRLAAGCAAANAETLGAGLFEARRAEELAGSVQVEVSSVSLQESRT